MSTPEDHFRAISDEVIELERQAGVHEILEDSRFDGMRIQEEIRKAYFSVADIELRKRLMRKNQKLRRANLDLDHFYLDRLKDGLDELEDLDKHSILPWVASGCLFVGIVLLGMAAGAVPLGVLGGMIAVVAVQYHERGRRRAVKQEIEEMKNAIEISEGTLRKDEWRMPTFYPEEVESGRQISAEEDRRRRSEHWEKYPWSE